MTSLATASSPSKLSSYPPGGILDATFHVTDHTGTIVTGSFPHAPSIGGNYSACVDRSFIHLTIRTLVGVATNITSDLSPTPGPGRGTKGVVRVIATG